MTGAPKIAVDFEAIIQADRQRRKDQALAEQIFGRGRRSGTPNVGSGPRKPGTGPSLASRVGVRKRSPSQSTKSSIASKPSNATTPTRRNPLSASNVDSEWAHGLHDSGNSDRGTPSTDHKTRTGRNARATRLNSALNGSASSPDLNSQFNIVGQPKSSNGISIRGLAGPCMVRAENFALGTSAADIESAMTPIGGQILSCKLVSSSPRVIAELVFETKEGADLVVEQFHNQIADGRILSLYHKPGSIPSHLSPQTNRTSTYQPTRYGSTPFYEPRGRGRDEKQNYSRGDIMDGTYGFDDRMDTGDNESNQHSRDRNRGLYSDSLISRRDDHRRGRGQSRDMQRGVDGGRDGGRGGGRGYR